MESVMPSNHLVLCHPFLLLPSIFPSIRVFSNEFFTSGGQSIGVSASTSVIPMNTQDSFMKIPFRMDWLDLVADQGTLKSSPTPQFNSINSSVLSFLYSQLSYPYMTTGNTIALTRWTFVGKVVSLFFNVLNLYYFFIKWSWVSSWPHEPRLLFLSNRDRV